MSEDEDSSKSSESTESASSEEAAADAEPSEEPLQPAVTETDMSNAMEETNPTGTQLPSTAGPSPATLDTAALPDPEDPQASTDTDTLHLMPDDPSQTLGVDVSQDMPSDPAHDSINTGTDHILPDTLEPGLKGTGLIIGIDGTNQPRVSTTTATYQEFPKGATPPFTPHIIKSSSTAPPVQIPIGSTMTGVPVCFTFQFATSEPEPPRGDSM